MRILNQLAWLKKGQFRGRRFNRGQFFWWKTLGRARKKKKETNIFGKLRGSYELLSLSWPQGEIFRASTWRKFIQPYTIYHLCMVSHLGYLMVSGGLPLHPEAVDIRRIIHLLLCVSRRVAGWVAGGCWDYHNCEMDHETSFPTWNAQK